MPADDHDSSPAASPADCPVTGSSDWAAWVNAMPGPDSKPTLIVTGKVTVPSGGYSFEWNDVRVAESYPVQVSVTLKPIPPSGPATQAVTIENVRGSWPMSDPVGAVTIRCGSQVLTRISPVETVH